MRYTLSLCSRDPGAGARYSQVPSSCVWLPPSPVPREGTRNLSRSSLFLSPGFQTPRTDHSMKPQSFQCLCDDREEVSATTP